ncbi:WYL domain-containing protein [Aliarcobacter skirrowii]|uniref:WYL domain-containing protein n=1 Tax=Aliarcobacter skirrowii TaxID=28200 RepID=UPI0029B9896C|nr:WYL domain-containing protein [Aliarcobacter skirrowii]MDX4066073.1 WYL domain-containing protein [Aliarcobacter skirrowii]
MNERVIKIYKALYSNVECTKEYLKNYLEVSSIKTVENNIKDIDDVVYDIKLRKYRFKELLPKYIPNEVFFEIFQSAIVNKLLENDFSLLKKDISSLHTNEMIKTSELSNLAKKIIQFNNAIKDNCILKVKYKKVEKKLEEKYIKPNTIFSTGFTYYAYVTYDKLNKIDIGEQRTFAFNSIGDIEAIEYIPDGNFKIDQKGNAFGSFKKDKFVILNMDRKSADFFKREMLFNNDAFEMVDEELEGESITVKMYFNDKLEVVKLVQQWMPRITIQSSEEIKKIVYEQIKNNIIKLEI